MTAPLRSTPRPDSHLLHFRATLLPLDPKHSVAITCFGFLNSVEAAQMECTEHARQPLRWDQVHSGLWEASSTAYRYQVVLFLGALA